MKEVYVFDFDGTLTRRDTLLEFIRFAKGNVAFGFGFLLYSPILVLMKLHLYPNWKAKQQIFSYFFRGQKAVDFDAKCRLFAREKRSLIRQKAVAYMEEAQRKGAQIIVVSASIDNWVQPFFPQVRVVGTKIEVENDRLTGRFLTKNCYGKEKINRLKEVLSGPREDYYITAFGDSRGDKELLEYADKGIYRPFR
ncbi:MAG: haloacid dehalogenase-like hydrolase [Prevotella sp.]|jgi:phosphatidylglycerophosphatase C|nr:haloacid dehalogenase-like hydrolase [Prevotella sp.]MCI1282148.1 haloacid dehalogenase-like hydrolase [Prevotella sp.]